MIPIHRGTSLVPSTLMCDSVASTIDSVVMLSFPAGYFRSMCMVSAAAAVSYSGTITAGTYDGQ